jgi:ABC-type multidrug transport system fused ATPase/permease subunit
MEVQYAGLIGIYGGLFMGLAGWYFGRKRAKKKRGVDEMHDYIMKTARSYSWFATIGAMYILFTLYAIGIQLHVPVVLSILLLVQLGTWGMVAPFMHYLYSTGKEINHYVIAGMAMMFGSVALFTTLTILTKNWTFFFVPPIFIIIGFYFMKQGKGEN